jgi:nicotinate-nucleotide adenylyltransferase
MHKSAPVRFGSIKVRPPLALPGQRIGLLGGSFNPPHAAHRLISEMALKRLGLDRVWWMVTPGNPLKSKSELATLADRLGACRAIARDPRIIVTAFEADLGTAYTAATLAFLKARYPRVRFVWLMGGDNLAGMHDWQHWRDIFASMPIAAIDRPGWRLKALSSPAARAFATARVAEASAGALPARTAPAWTFLTGPLSELSSTVLRAIRKGPVAKKTQGPAKQASNRQTASCGESLERYGHNRLS